MKAGDATPWGPVQAVTELGEGIWFVSTASHGGYFLDRERNAKVPAYIKAATFNEQGRRGWYEEDCDAAFVALIFHEDRPQHFPRPYHMDAIQLLGDYRPEVMNRYWGITGKVAG